MKWSQNKVIQRWNLVDDTGSLIAFIVDENDWHVCYLMHTARTYDAKYHTLEEAKAWCEAMCALRTET